MGGKSDGLRRLVEAGERVPPFVVVDSSTDVAAGLQRLGTGPYAVRSDADDEDGSGSAQAGRYASFLNVSASEVRARVEDVRRSYEEQPFDKLRDPLGGPPSAPNERPISSVPEPVEGPSVIVQRMVSAAFSGVAFSVHPAGILDQVVVSAGPGAGAVVAGEDAHRTWVTSTADGRRYTYASSPDVADLLTPEQIDEVTAAALRIAGQHDRPIDLEWAYGGATLWILQARPITTLTSQDVATLDNSNLVESYPGLVSPLTASFVPRAYEGVFGSLAMRVTRDPELVAAYAAILPRMVATSSGRLYYRMESWYAALSLMPFAKRYIGVWQTSLGITERSYEAPPVRVGRLRRLRTALGVVRELWRTPRELDRLHCTVAEVAAWFPSALAAAGSIAALADLYRRVESELLARWDVTLLNDARAFIAPALLRLAVRNDTHVNDLVSGNAAIESLKPVRALAALAADAPLDLAQVTTAEAAVAYLAADTPYAARLRTYVDTYGDRYLEELKLESPTLRTDPLLLIETVRSFAGPAADAHLRAGGTETRALKSRNPLVRALARAATQAIAGRESSRLDRARVYGMVRAIALRAGEMLTGANRIDDPRDVFWLTMDEALDPSTGSRTGGGSLRDRISQRQRDHASYALLPPFRRLTFAGEPFDVHVPLATPTDPTAAAGDTGSRVRSGVGVSGGTATGQVLVVTDPRTVGDATGKVLVTTMTDPGWVFLISRAAAVVAERGSLLSHTAIVARELGVPAVVGIADATRVFTDGETVTVDGVRGEVRRHREPGAGSAPSSEGPLR